jgi:hypothetical protein
MGVDCVDPAGAGGNKRTLNLRADELGYLHLRHCLPREQFARACQRLRCTIISICGVVAACSIASTRPLCGVSRAREPRTTPTLPSLIVRDALGPLLHASIHPADVRIAMAAILLLAILFARPGMAKAPRVPDASSRSIAGRASREGEPPQAEAPPGLTSTQPVASPCMQLTQRFARISALILRRRVPQSEQPERLCRTCNSGRTAEFAA